MKWGGVHRLVEDTKNVMTVVETSSVPKLSPLEHQMLARGPSTGLRFLEDLEEQNKVLALILGDLNKELRMVRINNYTV